MDERPSFFATFWAYSLLGPFIGSAAYLAFIASGGVLSGEFEAGPSSFLRAILDGAEPIGFVYCLGLLRASLCAAASCFATKGIPEIRAHPMARGAVAASLAGVGAAVRPAALDGGYRPLLSTLIAAPEFAGIGAVAARVVAYLVPPIHDRPAF
ncbi:MAG: hypothetical protein JSR54_09240 [Proteobacteria bacterium]|nr:hypothetical protein [Pseudomonadota bacterium]